MNGKRQAWAVVAVTFAAGVAITVNQFKVPPVLPGLMAGLRLDMVSGGWLMSVFAVAAILLSIPAAVLLGRLGPRRSGLLALACVVAGSLLGAVAGSAALLMLSRVVEGISVAVMAVVAPALISLWFGPRERGLPMGIWAAWVPVGNVIIFNSAPGLEAALGWRSIWWLGALLALAVLLAYGLVARAPRRAGAAAEPPPGALTRRGLFAPASWLLGLAFATFTFALIAYNTWAPSYLAETLAMPAATASFYASLMFVAGIAGNLAAGWIVNRTRHRYALLVGALAVTAILYFWGFRLGSASVVVPYMLALGFVSNLIPPTAFTLAPETVARPELAGLAMAILNTVANAGILVGPPWLGARISGSQWAAGSSLLIVVTVVGIVAALLAWRTAESRAT